jgi:hypothetical protein
MKKLLTFICCILTFGANAQQKFNTFYIVDSASKKAIPVVSITLVRAKLSITTEKDGIFTIPGNIAMMRDTVVFYAQNYLQLKMPLHKLDGMDTIKLNKFVFKPLVTKLNYKEDTLLNDFKRRDVSYYAGIDTETMLFEYLQLAQQFEVPKIGIKLKSVTMNRLAFSVDYQTQYDFTELEHTKFRIHIYDINQVTGGPGNDLCDQVIEVKSGDSRQLGINLKKYNIVIPNKTFFIAVEWLRDNFNIGYSMVYDEKLKKDVKRINYRPAIGISPITGKKLNIWGLEFNHEWKLYTYFSPFGTDLAIKATIEY